MKTFKLSGTVTIGIYTEVEAESLEEAIKIAQDRCIEKSHWGDKFQAESVWVNEEYDGEPQNIHEI